MSVSDIVTELPKLSAAELMLVRRKLIEIAAETDEIAAANDSALAGAQILDRLEAEGDAR